MGRLLAESRGAITKEIDAMCRQADRDHQTLDRRLEGLIYLLETAEAKCWDDAVREFNLFYDILEQHEEQEQSSVGWLRPQQENNS